MQFYEDLLLTSQHNFYRADSIHIAQEAWGKMLRYCCTTCMHEIWGVVVIRAAPSLLQPSSCAASTSRHPAQECGQWTGKWTEHLIWPQHSLLTLMLFRYLWVILFQCIHLYKMDWHQVWVVGGYVCGWRVCVADGCGQLDGCGWFWVVCGWRDVCGWWVWMAMGCGWLRSMCDWRGMGGHRGVTSWRYEWLREIMRKYILDDVSNATKIPSQSSDWQALMRLRTLSPALATSYKTEQAPQCLVSTLYFWSAIYWHLHKMQSCLVFIHRECSLVYHMYNDIKLIIIIARFVVMWYSMPPIYIYILSSLFPRRAAEV